MKVFYYKFSDKSGGEVYASIAAKKVDDITPEQKADFYDRLQRLCGISNIEEVSKEEFDARNVKRAVR